MMEAATVLVCPAEVDSRLDDFISFEAERFAERHCLEVTAWHKDQPVWLIGPIHISVVRHYGELRLEIHNGDFGHQHLPTTGERRREDLRKALDRLMALGT